MEFHDQLQIGHGRVGSSFDCFESTDTNTTTDAGHSEKICACSAQLKKETTTDPRDAVVTEVQLSDISEDVGTCWRRLGPKLNIAESHIENIDDEQKKNHDKAHALLKKWSQQEGRKATVGCLADALCSIGKRCFAEKLLGVSDLRVPTFTQVSEGEEFSLKVVCTLNATLDNKLMLCEDGQGNKVMVTGCNRDWNLEEMKTNAQFPETVTAIQEKGKTAEKKQQSLKCISTELQLLKQQLKERMQSCHTIDDPKENKQPPKEQQLQDHGKLHQAAECLLYSCEEQRSFCQGIYDVLIELIADFHQLRNDNLTCIKQFFDLTKHLKDQRETFFVKINQLHSLKQQLNEPQVAQENELEKWSRKQEKQIEEVEKLLTNLLNRGQIEQKQKPLRTAPESGTRKALSFGRKGRRRSKTVFPDKSKSQNHDELWDADNISSPMCVHRTFMMDKGKKLKQ